MSVYDKPAYDQPDRDQPDRDQPDRTGEANHEQARPSRPINLNIDPNLDRLPPRPWDHHLAASHPIGPRHTDPEDLVLYAMQLITGEEAATIAQHIEHCAECSRELAHIQGDLGAYAFTAESNQPSDRARQRLLRQVSREKRVAPSASSSSVTITAFGRSNSILNPVEEKPQPQRQVGRAVFAWTGWAIAAGLAVVAGLLYKDTGALRATIAANSHQVAGLTAEAARSHQLTQALTDPKAMRVTLTTKPVAKPKPEPIAGATYNADKGTLVFLASGLDPLETYKTYELWLIPADGTAPVPAGTFHPDDHGNASLIMPDLPKGVAAKGFGVTIEDEGGSQTPTQPIIMAGF
jgi:anti-sigma-K factor RskA